LLSPPTKILTYFTKSCIFPLMCLPFLSHIAGFCNFQEIYFLAINEKIALAYFIIQFNSDISC
jgi:hypothetical protein